MHIRFARAAGVLTMAALCLAACSEAPTRSTKAAPVEKALAATANAANPDATIGKEGLHFTDARPAKDKSFSTHSLWITSCNYGVFTVGEPVAAHPAMDTLRADILSLPSMQGSGHDMRVDHYVVYFNPARKLQGMAVGVGVGGIVGAAIESSMVDANKGSKCPASKMDGGWYGPGELTTPYSPLIVEISGKLDGKSFHTRTVYSPTAELSPKIKKPFEVAEFEAALHKANHDLFESMGLLAVHESAKAVVPTVSADPTKAPVSSTAAQPQPDDEGWINMPSSGAN